MPRRLVDRFHPGDVIEVLFAAEDAEGEWRPARVLALQHPGVWVRSVEDGKLWFVTNGQHIRPVSPGPRPAAS